ncbi:MAG: hypothetical protein ACR2MX_00905 [Cyclobacteriaceae bacterium]
MNYSRVKLTTWVILANLLVPSCRQQPYSQSLSGFEIEQQLITAYDEMIAADPAVRYDSLAPNFRQAVIKALSKNELFEYPFDSLATRLKMIRSLDGKLRVFSWDEKTGGSRHDFSAIAQYLSQKDEVVSRSINNFRTTGEKEYTEAGYYEIHILGAKADTKYLLLGWGTFGAGHQHYVARALEYQEGYLVDCDQCFEGKDFWPIVLSRRDKADLSFNPQAGTIKHKQFREDEETGFYAPTGKVVELKWDGTAFQKSLK